MLSLITTSTARPYCFSLLEKFVQRQTLKPDQWIVVGEDLAGYAFTMGQEVIHRKKNALALPLPSICENWLACLPRIKGDLIAVAEDDDYYHPTYLASLVPLLAGVRLAGVKHDLYYQLPPRQYRHMGNAYHASLACSAFTREMLPYIKRCRLYNSVFIDCYLWAEGTQENNNWALIPNKATDGRALHVGMKCMPGSAGLGIGHSNQGAWASDKRMATLSRWIGAEDCRLYRSIPKSAWNPIGRIDLTAWGRA
jgi:hypothetical protein